MKNSHSPKPVARRVCRIEPLENRIAPALAIQRVVGAVTGSPLELHAGDMLSTSALGGSYLLFIEKGNAVIYTTDLNNNNQVDFNEITGISAGNGLRMISFVDIHGDIVTNLNADGHSLSDSDNNATNGRDGRVVLDSKIEKIELRSLTQADLPAGQDVNDRLALSTYSIFGNVYAGGGFGASDGGLIIDVTGKTLQAAKFAGFTGISAFVNTSPQIGSIKVGTAVSGEQFSFGTSLAGFGLGFGGEDVGGSLVSFRPASGEAGADITGVRMANNAEPFNLGTLQAGDGGFNGRGGNISNITLTGDFAGGYKLVAGNGGNGNVGQNGGSISNFQDLGSITSEVVLQAGNGGEGLLGVGGNGGSVVLSPGATVNIAARLIVNLGNGGPGLTGGGAGGSEKNAVITSPEGTVPTGLSTVSSTHAPGDIYNTIGDGTHFIRGFDFDGDGFNDVVYTSENPDQLVVLFGSANGFDELGERYPGALGTQYLNAPPNAEALVVADLNGDGRPDIAAASQDETSAGVSVYLSNYMVNPVTSAQTLVGFRDPAYVALPQLSGSGYFQKALPITALTSGDYNGDGIVDLAINTVQTPLTGGVNNVVMVLRGDAVGGVAIGHFFADFRTGVPIAVLSPDANPVVLKTSALVDGGQDYLFGSAVGSTNVTLFNGTTGTLVPTVLSLGQIDTNRNVSAPLMRDNIQLQDAHLRDFTILDLNNDGRADIVVLSGEPAGFLVTLQGNGAPGGFTLASNDPTDDTLGRTDENTGIAISANPPEGLGLGTALMGILTAAAQGDGRGNDVSIVAYRSNPNAIEFVNLSFTNFFTATNAGTEPGTLLNDVPDTAVLSFDTLRPTAAAGAVKSGFSFAPPTHDAIDDFIYRTVSAIPDLASIANNGYLFKAGDGGDSAIGRGGAGGQLGDQLLSVNGKATGSLSIVVPANDAFEPLARFIAGNGGDGYTAGGKGGDVRGLSVTQASAATDPFTVESFLFAGSGGDSVKGTGGAGGNLSGLSILGGEVFHGGNGGRGLVGGAGGSILGNKGSSIPDATNTQTVSLAVEGGHGGLGMKAGGAGGNISDFTPDIRPVLGDASTVLFYRGGEGGNSLSGTAGKGGSVTNSSPVSTANNLVSDIHLEGGRGGDGLTGGAGGAVTGFVNSPGQGSLPLSVTVLGGYGGIGTARNGGAGGAIQNVNITARGVGFDWAIDFARPQMTVAFPGTPVTAVNFGRYVAGEGAVSYGGTGGLGGALSTVTGVATSASFAIAAGKGGDGLRAGGAGGGIGTATINAAAALGKVIGIAGDGGDVYSSVATSVDPLAFGGVNGPGGNGGGINVFKQDASQSTIVDLISGNGGSTINHGSSLDLTTNAGRGGSISNVTIAGDIGDVSATAAIVAYNDINAGQLVSDFVTNTLIGAPTTDLRTAGNVGIVVGATGRVRDNNGDGELDPASVGINGSLTNVLASNIMSAVAGSVDRIASIQSLSNVEVRVEGAIYGADKSVPPPATAGSVDYLDSNGNLIHTPELGGELLDGAIIAKNDRALKSIRDFIRR